MYASLFQPQRHSVFGGLDSNSTDDPDSQQDQQRDWNTDGQDDQRQGVDEGEDSAEVGQHRAQAPRPTTEPVSGYR